MVCQNERVGFGTGSVGRSVAGDMVEGNGSDALWLRVLGCFHELEGDCRGGMEMGLM